MALNFVHLRAASGDPNADLTSANRIFAPCCVQFVMASGQTAAPASSDTWLGGDTDIQKGTSCGVPTTEELDTFRGASAAFGLSGRIRAFYVASCNSGDRGYSWPPYCATGTATAVQGMAVVTNSGRPRTLAHELGHILLDSGDHPADTNNLMHPTNTATADQLTPAQCATIFTNA